MLGLFIDLQVGSCRISCRAVVDVAQTRGIVQRFKSVYLHSKATCRIAASGFFIGTCCVFTYFKTLAKRSPHVAVDVHVTWGHVPRESVGDCSAERHSEPNNLTQALRAQSPVLDLSQCYLCVLCDSAFQKYPAFNRELGVICLKTCSTLMLPASVVKHPSQNRGRSGDFAAMVSTSDSKMSASK